MFSSLIVKVSQQCPFRTPGRGHFVVAVAVAVAVAVGNSKASATVENVKWQNTHGRRPEGRGRERAKHLNLPCKSLFTVDSDAVFSLRLASRPPVLPDLQLYSSFQKLLTGYHTAFLSSLWSTGM